MRAATFLCLFLTWPCLQALFTVKSEQSSYVAELGGTLSMACRFSAVRNAAQISVIWRRIEPSPPVNVFQLESGRENRDFGHERFRDRARLLTAELENLRAVLEISRVRINDSGVYQCIVKDDETDYKQTRLTVRAPYTPVRKGIRQVGPNEVELSCESGGFPLARVLWSGSRLAELRSNVSSGANADGTLSVASRLNVTDEPGNYTCSFVTEDGRVNVSATFRVPGEIPQKGSLLGSTGLVIVAVVLMGVALCCLTLLIRHRKRKSSCREGADATGKDRGAPGGNRTIASNALLLSKTNPNADTFAIISEEVAGSAVPSPSSQD